MRRSDREVTDPVKIREIISACSCCRLGFCDGGQAYIVPMDFGFTEKDGRCTFYFHSAAEGRKAGLVRKGGWAAFEMDCGHELVEGSRACAYTARYCCVMGGGRLIPAETAEEKRAGLTAIMARLTGWEQWDFDEAVVEKTLVFRLEAEELTCKVHE